MSTGNINDYILHVTAGPDLANLVTVDVNNECQPIVVDSPGFVGYLVVRMQDFRGVTTKMEDCRKKGMPIVADAIAHPDSSYFQGRNRRYSIMLQGKFKRKINADDLIFGVDFDVPLRTPVGISLGLRIAKWLDPSLQCDLSCPKPFVFSPLISAMNSIAIYESMKTVEETIVSKTVPTNSTVNLSKIGSWAFSSQMIPEDTGLITHDINTYEKRKKHFSNKEARQQVDILPDYVYCMDFYDAYLDLNNFLIKLPGFSLNPMKYWDEQPLRFSCKTNKGDCLFVVMFSLVRKSNYKL
jgi:hypothetical protein